MYPKRSGQGNGPVSGQVRSSDRIKARTNPYGQPYFCYNPNLMRNRKSRYKYRTVTSQIAKILCPENRHAQDLNAVKSGSGNLHCSTRKRRIANVGDYTDSFGAENEDLMINNSVSQYEIMSSKCNRAVETKSTPRREGLRPRHLGVAVREKVSEQDDVEELLEEKVGQDETDNGNDADDAKDGVDEEGKEEQDGRRRYDLRNRADVSRLSVKEGKALPRSPRRVLRQGMGTKVNRYVRRGGSRVHKHRRLARTEDSDDSILVDELDQGLAIPWVQCGSGFAPPWPFGGLDMHGTTAWGLNLAASGWGHQGDALATTDDIETAGASFKGGADIQPLQLDDSVSFDDIGGLSEYIDALKEMVFFPLLYPDFFASYNITPPRGVLLCGPPGTGKTLIARALACAASKSGQKVNFYMRKGADVLSKWVGEAERQLKLLFEEAQKNQPSIIFFDEIDGLAPARSSKQEQTHNSIVSTLLALMDGLDSRGQVVLIGATNRVDAIDGALRRPGRFDREFNFPLPGCEARAEILGIHTRKWKHPPSEELKKELASSCVGYCGADLKALCTEAAIQAFRQRYPQVYRSDDKFLIDVDSVKVEKYHFIEAMSTITPSAHRGAVVHSRPLSLVVQPCLCRHLEIVMNIISDIFPAVSAASELTKPTILSRGSVIPLVYRPRLLLCGSEGTGLDHLGPAVLHELEKFPVHSLSLLSLLSDSSAKTPEEALIHIFCEARRTMPSILYLPQFDVWWETAHEQLRAVLLTLLEELPSDLPILLLGTTSVQLAELDESHISVFRHRSVYQVKMPSTKDRTLFFDHLVEAILSVFSEGTGKKSQDAGCLSELPKAPKQATGLKVSELKAKVEAEQHALRRLRMCLRDVCNRILYDKRFNAFHYPVSEDDAPNYHSITQNPMDMATMLQHVDNGQYITRSAFLQDIYLIVSNAKAYNGEDYKGTRIVSRACELRDLVLGMVSQIDPELVAYCDKIAAQGGPVQFSDELGISTFLATPVVPWVTATRTSARLRNVQPEFNMDQSYEALKRTNKKSTDVARDRAQNKLVQDPLPSKTCQKVQANDIASETLEPASIDGNLQGTGASDGVDGISPDEDATMSDGEFSTRMESVKHLFVERSDNYSVPQLERLYSRIMKGVYEAKGKGTNDGSSKTLVLNFLLKFVEDHANF